ncbi:MAG TPA: MobF family relaxase, partial [Candidatus Paceibacterota bacterium]|nr:MobF family relaxase [Candidatus Paceibacterota bacterium]
MITARTQKSVRNAKRYFREHLAHGDYYSEGHKLEGHWVGRGAERLGLPVNGPVGDEAYDRLCDNRHPLTGEKLTVRTRKQRRIYDDFAISPPKSVSIMAVTMGDERIVAAHDRAVDVAIVELEKAACARVRQGNRREARTTGEIVAGVFRHDASRALDPLLHTHLVVFNATWDPVESRWKALEAGTMFEQTKFLTEVYRNHLAGELTGMGYRLRTTKNGYEIAGVPEDVIERLSKRSRAIAHEEGRIVEKLGKPLTNNARAAVAHSTRQRKLRDIPATELVRRQQEQLTPEELALLEGLRTGKVVPLTPTPPQPAITPEIQLTSAPEPNDQVSVKTSQQPPEAAREQQVVGRHLAGLKLPDANPPCTPQQAVEYARDHVFERASVTGEHELLTVALGYSRGRLTLDQIRGAVGPQTDLIRVEGMLTTGQALADEKRMITLVNEGVGQYRPLNPSFRPAPELSAEQRRVVEAVLGSPDAVMGIRGGAGAGKTFVLNQLVAGVEARDHEVFLFAPTAAAVEVLREEGFVKSQTVQHLLQNPALQAELQRKAVVVDEAGLLSNRQMVQLLELRRSADARLILCGDTREHTGVEAGDALRLLEGRSTLQVAELGEIRRQTEVEYRQAIAEIAAGHPTAAFARLDRM